MVDAAERIRLEEDARREKNWKRWGPYLSERQWGTVREDYSADGNVWSSLPHDHARSRAYRWGEDGLLGITDRECRLCFGLALWNEQDQILKERLFGLTGPEGNHGEDVKELYYYLDSLPTHAYMKALYKYPQSLYPYSTIVEENACRGLHEREYEITDAGLFAGDRYFDVFAEYAKGSPNDILIHVTIANRGPESAPIHVLPQLWFRNTWIWGCRHEGCTMKPRISPAGDLHLVTTHESLEPFHLLIGTGPEGESPELLFTENETNNERLFGVEQYTPYVKDAFHTRVIEDDLEAVNPQQVGTKAGAWYRMTLEPNSEATIRLRLVMEGDRALNLDDPLGESFDDVFAQRQAECERYYAQRIPAGLNHDEKRIARQAYAGLLWSKQFYHYIVDDWLEGDPATLTPPDTRKWGRNRDWRHLYSRDVISMPDKWEYPWFAAWDLAFHMVPMARIDPQFAKDQLVLFLREWYMHPNGQIPAYEFAFDDVNPPVHAWACWEVYKMGLERGEPDREFLASTFQKLLLNFTWWVNRKDPHGNHLFGGGFLGLDNIGVFDRSNLPHGTRLDQADGTAWMAFYCTTMLRMAIELASTDPPNRAYEDMASKFFEHFVAIVDAMNTLGGTGLWDEEDGFYYDQLHRDWGDNVQLKVRSLVGLIPLCAVEVLDRAKLEPLDGFRKRMDWFMNNRPALARHITQQGGDCDCRTTLLAILGPDRIGRVLQYMLDETEFLSPYGVRSLSKFHERHPYVFHDGVGEHRVEYMPGESRMMMFGGNSNWRGPVWFPINFLLIQALRRYHGFLGDDFRVCCPSGSDQWLTLDDAAHELARRLTRLFISDHHGPRPCHGDESRYTDNPHFRELLLFHEYFDGDTGRGLGASHQTGWTALVTRCLELVHDRERR